MQSDQGSDHQHEPWRRVQRSGDEQCRVGGGQRGRADRGVGGQRRLRRPIPVVSGSVSRRDGRRRCGHGRRAWPPTRTSERSSRSPPRVATSVSTTTVAARWSDRVGTSRAVSRSSSSATERRRRRRSCPGIAALLLAQTPGSHRGAAAYAHRAVRNASAGTTRSDSYGWGIANAYNALDANDRSHARRRLPV